MQPADASRTEQLQALMDQLDLPANRAQLFLEPKWMQRNWQGLLLQNEAECILTPRVRLQILPRFDAIDADGSGTLQVAELVQGLLKVRGEVQLPLQSAICVPSVS